MLLLLQVLPAISEQVFIVTLILLACLRLSFYLHVLIALYPWPFLGSRWNSSLLVWLRRYVEWSFPSLHPHFILVFNSLEVTLSLPSPSVLFNQFPNPLSIQMTLPYLVIHMLSVFYIYPFLLLLAICVRVVWPEWRCFNLKAEINHGAGEWRGLFSLSVGRKSKAWLIGLMNIVALELFRFIQRRLKLWKASHIWYARNIHRTLNHNSTVDERTNWPCESMSVGCAPQWW